MSSLHHTMITHPPRMLSPICHSEHGPFITHSSDSLGLTITDHDFARNIIDKLEGILTMTESLTSPHPPWSDCLSGLASSVSSIKESLHAASTRISQMFHNCHGCVTDTTSLIPTESIHLSTYSHIIYSHIIYDMSVFSRYAPNEIFCSAILLTWSTRKCLLSSCRSPAYSLYQITVCTTNLSLHTPCTVSVSLHHICCTAPHIHTLPAHFTDLAP